MAGQPSVLVVSAGLGSLPGWAGSLTEESIPGWDLHVAEFALGAGRNDALPGGTAGWDLLPLVAAAVVVHVARPFSAGGELAVLAAASLGRPLVLSDLAPATSDLGRSLGMLQLADAVLLASAGEAHELGGGGTPFDFGAPNLAGRLRGVYSALPGVR